MGVYQACPHPTLPYTLIVLRGPRVTDRSLSSPALSFILSQDGLSVLWPKRGQGTPDSQHTLSSLGLNTSLSNSLRICSQRELGGVAGEASVSQTAPGGPHSMAQTDVRPQGRQLRVSILQQRETPWLPGSHVPLLLQTTMVALGENPPGCW